MARSAGGGLNFNSPLDGVDNDTLRIYINSTQYFDKVPKVAWEFYIGGYQPAQKWLKDRKDQKTPIRRYTTLPKNHHHPHPYPSPNARYIQDRSGVEISI